MKISGFDIEDHDVEDVMEDYQEDLAFFFFNGQGNAADATLCPGKTDLAAAKGFTRFLKQNGLSPE